MNILIDMNLSPTWVDALSVAGHGALHWSEIGDPRAPDIVLMNWARANEHVLFTNDLDLGTILALTRTSGPSVVQLRAQAVLPADVGEVVLSVLRQQEPALRAGALVTIDAATSRVRLLPLRI